MLIIPYVGVNVPVRYVIAKLILIYYSIGDQFMSLLLYCPAFGIAGLMYWKESRLG